MYVYINKFSIWLRAFGVFALLARPPGQNHLLATFQADLSGQNHLLATSGPHLSDAEGTSSPAHHRCQLMHPPLSLENSAPQASDARLFL